MFNIILDALPTTWNEYAVDMDFRTGIQISQCLMDEELSNKEKFLTAVSLMFPDEFPQDYEQIEEALKWYLSGWNPQYWLEQEQKKSEGPVVMDFDIDQGYIYAAFMRQYGMDLSKDDLHFWKFMGLLSCLDECTFTRIVSIREKKITSKMSKEEKEAIRKAKELFRIRKNRKLDEAEDAREKRQQAIEEFNRLRGAT